MLNNLLGSAFLFLPSVEKNLKAVINQSILIRLSDKVNSISTEFFPSNMFSPIVDN